MTPGKRDESARNELSARQHDSSLDTFDAVVFSVVGTSFDSLKTGLGEALN
jgi:hypothetical protein